jgi:hypothetical protein
VSDEVWAQLCPPPEPERVEEPSAGEDAEPRIVHGAEPGFTLHVTRQERMCSTCRSALITMGMGSYPDAGASDTVTVSMYNQPLIRMRINGHGGYTVEHMYPTRPTPSAPSVRELIDDAADLARQHAAVDTVGGVSDEARESAKQLFHEQMDAALAAAYEAQAAFEAAEIRASGQPQPVRYITTQPKASVVPYGQLTPVQYAQTNVLHQIRETSK